MSGSDSDPTVAAVDRASRVDPLLVLVAVSVEARRLARALGLSADRAEEARRGVILRAVGLGSARLPALSAALLAFRPRAVLAAGLCGGCAPEMAPGDLVIGSPVTLRDTGPAGPGLRPPAELVGRARRALEAAGLPYRIGPLVTVNEVAATPAAKAACWRRHGALAVDMESAHILDWARRAGVPALAVRAVADGPAETLPAALARAVAGDGRLRLPAALVAVTRPGAAWRLWRRSRVALDRLAAFLAAFTASRP